MTEPFRYLLDTSAVIDLPDSGQVRPGSEYLISTITVAELDAGIHTTDDPVERARRLARLHGSTTPSTRWPSPSRQPGCTASSSHSSSRPGAATAAAAVDLLIGSVAAIHHMPLVTRNPDDFAGLEPMLTVVGIH